MVGIRDVARKAGVSTSSVSLVINNSGYVSADMREKVERAMAELHYVPNALGRNLSQNRTGMVGVIVPTIQHPFFATLTSHIQRELAARGLKTMLCSTVDAETGETEYVDMLRRRTMDAIIMGAHTKHDPEYWSSIGRPVVAFDRRFGGTIPSVHSNHMEGGDFIADHLIPTGIRRLVMIGGPKGQFYDRENTAKTKISTFPTTRYYVRLAERLGEAGIAHDYVSAGEVSDFSGYEQAVERVLSDVAHGTGEFADADAIVSSDIGAALAVQKAASYGIAVPNRLQIVAYDGTFATKLAGREISAVHQDFAGIARGLVERVCALIDGEEADDELVPVTWQSAETTIL